MNDLFSEVQFVDDSEFLMVGRLAYVQVAAKVGNLETLKAEKLAILVFAN